MRLQVADHSEVGGGVANRDLHREYWSAPIPLMRDAHAAVLFHMADAMQQQAALQLEALQQGLHGIPEAHRIET